MYSWSPPVDALPTRCSTLRFLPATKATVLPGFTIADTGLPVWVPPSSLPAVAFQPELLIACTTF